MSKEIVNGYYTVYTRQSKKVLEELEKTGAYRVKEEYIRMKNDSISEYYLKLYRWFAERCRERIDVPQGCSFPIWLSMHDEYRLRNTGTPKAAGGERPPVYHFPHPGAQPQAGGGP